MTDKSAIEVITASSQLQPYSKHIKARIGVHQLKLFEYIVQQLGVSQSFVVRDLIRKFIEEVAERDLIEDLEEQAQLIISGGETNTSTLYNEHF